MADYQSIKDRLIIFVNYTNLSISAFEKKCNLSNAYIRNFKGNLSAGKLEGILKAFPELNKDWLLTGCGEMINFSTKNSQIIEHNSGTAITGDNTVVNPPEVISVSKMQNQIDELIAQNGKLLDIIDRLTK